MQFQVSGCPDATDLVDWAGKKLKIKIKIKKSHVTYTYTCLHGGLS